MYLYINILQICGGANATFRVQFQLNAELKFFRDLGLGHKLPKMLSSKENTAES